MKILPNHTPPHPNQASRGRGKPWERRSRRLLEGCKSAAARSLGQQWQARSRPGPVNVTCLQQALSASHRFASHRNSAEPPTAKNIASMGGSKATRPDMIRLADQHCNSAVTTKLAGTRNDFQTKLLTPSVAGSSRPLRFGRAFA
jgi:hypothetical protein